MKNTICPTAIGKKNRLFVGEAEAGDSSAIITPSSKVVGDAAFDPYAYLNDVLTRLPRMTNRQIPEVTPEAWDKARRLLTRRSSS